MRIIFVKQIAKSLGVLFVLFLMNSTAIGARTFIEINREIKAWLNAESTSNSQFEQADCIYAMVELYSEIMQHPKLPISPTLNGHRVVLRGRMLHVRDELKRKLLRAERSGVVDKGSLLVNSLMDQMRLADLLGGGVTSGLGLGGNAGAAELDSARQLIDLIESTVDPNVWESKGGQAVMVYYPPLHVLVVRANSNVHAKVALLLAKLRAAR